MLRYPADKFPARRSKFPANTKHRFLISLELGKSIYLNFDLDAPPRAALSRAVML
jgi:hypothetical protein